MWVAPTAEAKQSSAKQRSAVEEVAGASRRRERLAGGEMNDPASPYDDFCRPFASSHFDLPEEQLPPGSISL